jgi:hypothetical protein
MTRVLVTYSIIQPPFTLSFQEMPKKQWRHTRHGFTILRPSASRGLRLVGHERVEPPLEPAT